MNFRRPMEVSLRFANILLDIRRVAKVLISMLRFDRLVAAHDNHCPAAEMGITISNHDPLLYL